MSHNSSLSVIIPTLNEECSLPQLLKALNKQEQVQLELIVADGGSTDKTQEIALSHEALWVSTEKGRGMQMNAGAAVASGDFLLFLHADSKLEDNNQFLANALQKIMAVEKNSGHKRVAGHFRLKFKREKKGSEFIFRHMEEKTGLNRTNTTNGDQGFLLRREFFHELRGFDYSMLFLEDQKLAENIRAKGKWVTLPGILVTSARRFELEGVTRRYILMSIIMGLYSTETEAFFKRVQGLYKVQSETEKLLLWPIFVIIWKMMWYDLGFVGSLKVWFYVGHYIRENSWQFFYLLDTAVKLGFGQRKDLFLTFYDRWLARILNFFVFDIISAIVAFCWFMLILGPVFRVLDGPARTR